MPSRIKPGADLIEFANGPATGCEEPGKKQFLQIARSNLKSVKK